MSKKKNALVLASMLLISLILLLQFYGSAPITQQNWDKGEQVFRPTEETAKLTKESKQIKIAVSMGPVEYAMLQSMNMKYMEEHGISVEINNISPAEAYDQFKRMSQLGEAPDLLLLDNSWVREFAVLGYLLPVDAYFTNESQSDQIEPIIEQLKWNGYIWGIPKDIDPYVLVWNDKALNYGKGLKPSAKFEEFYALCRMLANPEEGRHALYVNPNDPYALISLIWQLGGSWIDRTSGSPRLSDSVTGHMLSQLFDPKPKQGADSKSNVNGKPAMKGVIGNEAASAAGESEDAPAGPIFYRDADNEDEAWELLKQGDLAMMVTTMSKYRMKGTADIRYMEFDSKEDVKSGGWLRGRSFVVSSRTELEDEAMGWVKAMTSTDSQQNMLETTGQLPVVKSLYLNSFSNDNADLRHTAKVTEQGRVFPPDPYLPEKLEQLQQELPKLWKGDIDVKSFIERVDSGWRDKGL